MKILLDTSFLLPTIGINVTHPLIPQVLQKLASNPSAWQISYTEINLLELACPFVDFFIFKYIQASSSRFISV